MVPHRGTGGQKKLQACKPDSVSRQSGTAAIYLGQPSLADSICLPTRLRRALLRHRYIWHFSTQGLPRLIVANQPRRLLPYVFTIASCKRLGRYFLWHCLLPVCNGYPPVRWCVALCCPDFPCNAKALHDSAACSDAKIVLGNVVFC